MGDPTAPKAKHINEDGEKEILLVTALKIHLLPEAPAPDVTPVTMETYGTSWLGPPPPCSSLKLCLGKRKKADLAGQRGSPCGLGSGWCGALTTRQQSRAPSDAWCLAQNILAHALQGSTASRQGSMHPTPTSLQPHGMGTVSPKDRPLLSSTEERTRSLLSAEGSGLWISREQGCITAALTEAPPMG